MRGSTSGSLGPALLALLRRTAAASSRQSQQHQAVTAGAAAFSSSSSSSSPLHPPSRWASPAPPRPLIPASAASSSSSAAPLLHQQQHRSYAKKASGKGGGAAAKSKLSGAAVSASPDDPDAAPPPPRVRPPFVAAARRRRRALLPPLSRATRDALAVMATLTPAAAADADASAPAGEPSTPTRPHLLRDMAWPLEQGDALVLLHDATLGDTTGPGHTLLVPHVTHDILQSAQGVASFVAECLQDGVEFPLVEQFFVQTLAAQGQEQAAEEAARAQEDAENAARRAAEERRRREEQAAQAAGTDEASADLSLAPETTPKKTGITDFPDRPFRPPRLLVRGMRVQIKGRLKGKGGKAEKKTWSWGATSAATFSDPVDFAQAQAETRAGTVGVKVWLVFREDAFDRESYALLRRRARDPATGRALWRGPGWAADAVEELALAPRSGASRATGLAGSAVRRPLTAWWSRAPDAGELAAFGGGVEGGGGKAAV